MAKKNKIGKAPTQIIPLPNPDKKKHEVYKKGDNPIRFCKPFRLSIVGSVNSGKSLLALHVIMAHQAKKPRFDEIHVCHGHHASEEYKRIDPTSMSSEIKSYDEFDPDKSILYILDDVDYTSISKEDLKKISELVRFGSTHHKSTLSLIFLHQSWFRLPKIVKDCSNVFIIFKCHDNDEMQTIGRRIGLKKNQILQIFRDLMPNWRDSLLVNLIPSAPSKYAKNLFEPIELNSDED